MAQDYLTIDITFSVNIEPDNYSGDETEYENGLCEYLF